MTPDTQRLEGGRHGLTVILHCTEPGCRARHEPLVYSRLSKLGATRLQFGAVEWYVDGGTVHCPNHVTEEEKARLLRETWGEYDLDNAAVTLGISYRIERECHDRYVVVP